MYLKAEETSPYYRQRKKEMKREKAESSPRPLLMDQVKLQVEKDLMKGTIRPQLRDYVHRISVQPLYSINLLNHFDESKYPLSESQKVPTVSDNSFETSNYYNYLYSQRHRKELFKATDQLRTDFQLQIMKDQKPIMKETMNESVQHIRGDNISQFKPQPEILNSQNEGHLSQTKLSALSPNHTYMLDKSRNFIPKELEKSNGRRNAPLISY